MTLVGNNSLFVHIKDILYMIHIKKKENHIDSYIIHNVPKSQKSVLEEQTCVLSDFFLENYIFFTQHSKISI